MGTEFSTQSSDDSPSSFRWGTNLPIMTKIEKEITVANRQGLHARPAAMFVQIATKYRSNITVKKDKDAVNGKSIMGVLMLGAQYNCKVMIIAEGDDAIDAMNELEGFLGKNE